MTFPFRPRVDSAEAMTAAVDRILDQWRGLTPLMRAVSWDYYIKALTEVGVPLDFAAKWLRRRVPAPPRSDRGSAINVMPKSAMRP